MKELAADESLSEEARDSAKKALEVLVSSQLLDIEQTAALKKLESDALGEAHKVRVAALAKAKTAEATAMLQAAEIKEMEAEAQSKRKKADAKKMLQAAEGLGDGMMEWLGQHRLQQCAADMVRIAGAYARPHRLSLRILVPEAYWWWSVCRTVLPSDLQYLTDEDVEEIGGPCRQSHKGSG